MRTGYDIFIDEVACAMEDHSPEIEWFYDFDAQTTVANMPFGDCHPEKNHRLLPIEPLDSREGFRMMEDFVSKVKNRGQIMAIIESAPSILCLQEYAALYQPTRSMV